MTKTESAELQELGMTPEQVEQRRLEVEAKLAARPEPSMQVINQILGREKPAKKPPGKACAAPVAVKQEADSSSSARRR